MINEKSQGNVARHRHLCCSGLFSGCFATHLQFSLLAKELFNINKDLVTLQAI